MSLPVALASAIEAARQAMREDALHDLPFDPLHAIWAGMGARQDPRQLPPCIGHQRRFELADLSTRYALPVWQAARPYDDLPTELLSMARGYLHGQVSLETVEPGADQAAEFFDRECTGPGYYPALEVLNAALATLYVAVLDAPFDPWNRGFELSDDPVLAPYHVEPITGDWPAEEGKFTASGFAATAFARGTFLHDRDRIGRRQEYWEWWLDEAVPGAWNTRPMD